MNKPREERKVVTVLFCDMVGFTGQSESRDPEDVAAGLRSYHAHLRSELERHGGTVEKFIGDAVMALFGAPVAHEDDPERAVRAALAIRDWAREEGELEVRIGITTGEALVSLGARPEAGEGMASGDVVNTASRLQAAAPVNEILVDETTFRATEHTIDFEPAEPIEAKGKADPVPVWKALQAHAVVSVELRPQTPLVGRERERDLLVDALERVKREASPQLVTIVGVPGIGKSRLVAELFAEVERDPELIYWRHGRSLPYGEGVAFWAFAEMVKAQAGILHSDGEEAAAAKLHDAVASVVDAEDVPWIEARLQPLIGRGERAEDLEESFAAWRRFVEALADERPTVLVFEDLHWADDDLLDFVDHLVDWATGVPLLVVGTARPELLDRRPGWGGGKRNAIAVSLAPLDDVETAQLISGLLERPVLPAETQEKLLAHAGGNPLYAEQFARMLAERGDAGEVPETVQGIIAARLDALPPKEKGLLQDASVIGKLFWTGALEAVSSVDQREAEQLLHALERKEFVHRQRRSSVAGETEHAFAHLLVQDVAYSQIPRAARAERHQLAAEWIESLGRTEDRAELLAHHYLAALELSAAAGIDTAAIEKPARTALTEAGERSTALNSFTAAARFYSAALDLFADDDPERPYAVLRYQRARGFLGQVDVGASEQAIEALLAAGDRDTAAEAEVGIAGVLGDRGQRREGDEHTARALELVADAPPSAAKAAVLAERARSAMMAHESAPDVGREALAIADELGLDRLRAELLNTIGTVRVAEGDSGGFADLEKSLEIAFELNSPGAIQRTYNNLTESYRRIGDWAEATRLFAERRKYVERIGIPDLVQWTKGEEAIDAYYVGDWDRATEAADEVIVRVEAGSPHYLEAICRVLRAKMRMARGDEGGAHEDISKGRPVARRIGDPQILQPSVALMARTLLAGGNEPEASELASEALSIPPYFYSIVDLAFALHDLGRGDETRAWLEDYPGEPWKVAGLAIAAGDFHAAAEVLGASGNVAEESYCRLRSGTEADLRRAMDFYRSVGAAAYLREAEGLLAASA
jgi:class 3 adenylate cyclase/tetratricopeptide (TPR) repeat protein